jgi:hypothetical protein
MNAETRKYIRILDAQLNIQKQLTKLHCVGINWQKELGKMQELTKKYNDYEVKLNQLSKEITQIEFESFLSERMCCSWEEFIDGS